MKLLQVHVWSGVPLERKQAISLSLHDDIASFKDAVQSKFALEKQEYALHEVIDPDDLLVNNEPQLGSSITFATFIGGVKDYLSSDGDVACLPVSLVEGPEPAVRVGLLINNASGSRGYADPSSSEPSACQGKENAGIKRGSGKQSDWHKEVRELVRRICPRHDEDGSYWQWTDAGFAVKPGAVICLSSLGYKDWISQTCSLYICASRLLRLLAFHVHVPLLYAARAM
jgi:hypothetical protein